MNNDMAKKLNNHIATRKMNGANNNAIQKKSAQKSTMPNIGLTADTFTQLNYATENISESILKSTQEFLNHPEIVKSYVEICDEFVNKGSHLREAIDKTDRIFEMLRTEELYK